jgi:hypothetical protein
VLKAFKRRDQVATEKMERNYDLVITDMETRAVKNMVLHVSRLARNVRAKLPINLKHQDYSLASRPLRGGCGAYFMRGTVLRCVYKGCHRDIT